MTAAADLLAPDERSPVRTHRPASVLDAPPASSRRAQAVATLATAALHLGLVGFATFIGVNGVKDLRAPAAVTEMIEVELPAPPRAEAQAEPAPVRTIQPRATEAPREAPPPAAAQAGQVLTAADEVVDFGDTFVAGKGAAYAGGVTESEGTATHAVRDSRATARGAAGGTGTNLGGDLTRAPRLAGGAEWDCPFPPEADDAGVDHAVVALRVEVGADGRVKSASATGDPGHGFGREARRCAQSKRWSAGLDRAGSPTGAVALVNVRFDR